MGPDHLDQDSTTTGHVLNAAVNHHLTENQANALADLCENLTGPELVRIRRMPDPAYALGRNRARPRRRRNGRARETDTGEEVLATRPARRDESPWLGMGERCVRRS